MRLTENTVLITGGGSGIGSALAERLLARNNRVLICGRDPAKLNAAVQRHAGMVALRCDLTSRTDAAALVAAIEKDYPGLNILINNAGIQLNYGFLDGADHADHIDAEMDANFTAHARLTSALLPVLSRQTEAAIVNVSSALSLVPKQSAPIYCASKAAMHIFTEALRYQMEGTAIKVFEIVPALVDTAMTAGRGRGKISPAALADEALRALERDRLFIKIGKTKILFALHRCLPAVAKAIIQKG